MPTASEFELAAGQFDRAATTAARWADGTDTAFGAATVFGGALSTVCQQAVDTTARMAATTSAALTEQAALCRQRAAQVRAYESALAAYRTDHNAWRTSLADLADGAAPPHAPRPPLRPSFAP